MRALLIRLLSLVIVLATVMATTARAAVPSTDTITIRGHHLIVHLYGTRGSGEPVIVSSGDGGWMHLAPHVAEVLADAGFFVVGFDARAYLETFTSSAATLRADDEPGDYRILVDYAARGSSRKPLLVGVSEGAGLSVLAASDPKTKPEVGGVIALGLPDLNELGWRWKDAVIYVTHGVPKEPTFSTAAIAGRIAPIPLAAIHSTQDEFVSVAEIRRVMEQARAPNRLWLVKASNHRFADNLPELDRRLVEAIDWVHQNQPH